MSRQSGSLWFSGSARGDFPGIGWELESGACWPVDYIGGRGRNRTYNLSVKSRAICSRSYC
jgi:hypothetical protein